MALHILSLAIFYATVLSISGQILKADTGGSGTKGVKDSVGGTTARPMTLKNLIEDYRVECHRDEIDANKKACGGKIPNASDATRHAVKEQNQVLLEAIIHSFIRAEEIPEFQPKHGFQLLNQTMKIYRKVCPDISNSFLNRIEYLFRILHYHFASTRSEFFKDVEKDTKWIESLLDKCMNEIEPLHFMMDPCKEMILGRKGSNLTFICTKMEEEANYESYDPILDIVWFIANAIRAGCFKFFHGSYLMWHHYFLALQDTFAPTVQIRWKAQIQPKRFWQALLGPNFPLHLADVEKCTKVIVDDSELGDFHITFSRGQFIPYSRMVGSE